MVACADCILAKTTDENLTSENWELILNLCDKVVEEGDEGCVSGYFAVHFYSCALQGSRGHSGSLEAPGASQSQCPALYSLTQRLALQELRNQSQQGTRFPCFHPGSREDRH